MQLPVLGYLQILCKNSQIGLDKLNSLWYNVDIRKREKMKSFMEIVASKMATGCKTESEKIAEIGVVLKEMGYHFNQRCYLLSHDEDFIPDVLACYKG